MWSVRIWDHPKWWNFKYFRYSCHGGGHHWYIYLSYIIYIDYIYYIITLVWLMAIFTLSTRCVWLQECQLFSRQLQTSGEIFHLLYRRRRLSPWHRARRPWWEKPLWFKGADIIRCRLRVLDLIFDILKQIKCFKKKKKLTLKSER